MRIDALTAAFTLVGFDEAAHREPPPFRSAAVDSLPLSAESAFEPLEMANSFFVLASLVSGEE